MVQINQPHSLTSAQHRPVRLRMRGDLIVVCREVHGTLRYFIKDPITQKHHQLWEQEYSLLKLLDGQRSPLAMKAWFEHEYQPAKLDLTRLELLHRSFYRQGLVLALQPGQAQSLWARQLSSRALSWQSVITSLLSFRLRGVNPNRWLTDASARLAWLFHPLVQTGTWIFVCITFLWGLINRGTLVERLPRLHEYLTVDNCLLLVATFAILKIVHELAHGLTCKHFGGECNELGVMFLLLTPCLYCDVSDAWLIEGKWRRACVSMAGVWAELTLASLCAWMWWFTYPGLINTLCLNVVLFGGLTTLVFNANPLMRYDGYFVMSDLLEQPNLWDRSRAALSASVSKFYFRSGYEVADEMPDRVGLGLAMYAILSIAYQWFVVIVLLCVLYKSLESVHLEALGAVLTGSLAMAMVGRPVIKSVNHLTTDPRKLKRLRRGRTAATLAVLGVMVIAFCYLPLPCSVHAPFVLAMGGAKNVVAPVEGVLVNCATEGSSIANGQVIAQLESPMVHLELESKRGLLVRQRARLAGLEARRSTDRIIAGQITTTQQAIVGLEAEIGAQQNLIDQMSIRAPMDGIVIAPTRRQTQEHLLGADGRVTSRLDLLADESEAWTGTPLDRENVGCTLSAGQTICTVAAGDKKEGRVYLTQSQVDWVAIGQSVTARVPTWPSKKWRGRVVEISSAATQQLPPILAHEELVANRPAAGDQFQSLQPMYMMRVEFDEQKLPLIDQVAGRLSIQVAPRSLGTRCWRLISEALGMPTQ